MELCLEDTQGGDRWKGKGVGRLRWLCHLHLHGEMIWSKDLLYGDSSLLLILTYGGE